MLILLALFAAGPQLGPIKSFGDWVVACDNVNSCEATSLPINEDSSVDREDDMVSIGRDPGPGGAVRVSVMLSSDAKGPGVLLVDGKRVADGQSAGGELTVAGPGALEAVRAMANGARVTATIGGKPVGTASLKGLSASLRFIDAQQGRAGGTTALVARGAKPASAVPAAAALPVIRRVVTPAGAAPAIGKAQRAAFMKLTKCDDDEFNADRQIETSRLDARTTLALVPCGAGAYNFSSVPVTIVAGRPTLARFDSAVGWGEPGAEPILVNAGFDTRTGTLSSYSKGRGLGDCGSSEEFVWDGQRFRLTNATSMGECRGSTNWLTIYRARAVTR